MRDSKQAQMDAGPPTSTSESKTSTLNSTMKSNAEATNSDDENAEDQYITIDYTPKKTRPASCISVESMGYSQPKNRPPSIASVDSRGSNEIPKPPDMLGMRSNRNSFANNFAINEDEEIEEGDFPLYSAPVITRPRGRRRESTVGEDGTVNFTGLNTMLLIIANSQFTKHKFMIPNDSSCVRWELSNGCLSKVLASQMIELIEEPDPSVYQDASLNVEILKGMHRFSIKYRDPHQRDANGEPLVQMIHLAAESSSDFSQWTSAVQSMILAAISNLQHMKQGSDFEIVEEKTQYTSCVRLNSDLSSISWGKNSVDHSLNLTTVKFVRVGQATPTFRNAKNIAHLQAFSFSLVYGSESKTLDLIARSLEDLQRWVPGLESLIKGTTDSLAAMQRGIEMIKIQSGKQKARTCRLSSDMTYLYFIPTSTTSKKIMLTAIKELRTGRKTDSFSGYQGEYPDSQCFSLIYGDSYKSLDFYIPKLTDYQDWTIGLEDLLSDSQEQSRELNIPDVPTMRALFLKHKTRKSDMLNAKSVMNIIFSHDPNLAISTNIKRIQTYVEELGGSIGLEKFIKLFQSLSLRPELTQAMKLYATFDNEKEAYFMTAAQLQVFLVSEQQESASRVTVDYCADLIQEFEPDEEKHKFGRSVSRKKLLSEKGFATLLLSAHGDAFNPAHDRVYQDMTQPLNHYFISSSHNTYLTADQLKGPSSVEAYIRTIQKGCRCIEIDCWDGPNGEPVVYHGHTLTSKIQFRDVILCINEYAFKETSYPLIISIENHCSLKQQKFMGQFMQSVFTTKLVAPLKESICRLPSPEELMNKILIKCHKPTGLDFCRIVVAIDDDGNTYFGEDFDKTEEFDMPLMEQFIEDEADKEDDAGQGACQGGTMDDRKRRSKTQIFGQEIRLHKDFADLIVYTASVPRFQGFEHARLKNKCWEMTSFGENRALQFSSDPLQSLAAVEYNKKQNSRIFPAGSRVDSSNYQPQTFWNMGVQMVALNFQTEGTYMQINQGKFRQNGNCGYVLKPSFLRNKNIPFGPLCEPGSIVNGSLPLLFNVTVLSAQYLPRAKIINPFVVVEILGIPADQAMQKTEIKNEEGQAPFWNETFSFPILVSELSMVRFIVKDYRGKLAAPEFVCEATIPLESLRQGYRHLRLNSAGGEPLNATLFLKTVKVNNFYRSNEWWSRLPKPPVRPKKAKVPIVMSGSAPPCIEALLSDVQSIYDKSLVLREKVLALRDKLLAEKGDVPELPRRGSSLMLMLKELSRDNAVNTHLAKNLNRQVKVILERARKIHTRFIEATEEECKEVLAGCSHKARSNERPRLTFLFNLSRVLELLLLLEDTSLIAAELGGVSEPACTS